MSAIVSAVELFAEPAEEGQDRSKNLGRDREGEGTRNAPPTPLASCSALEGPSSRGGTASSQGAATLPPSAGTRDTGLGLDEEIDFDLRPSTGAAESRPLSGREPEKDEPESVDPQKALQNTAEDPPLKGSSAEKASRKPAECETSNGTYFIQTRNYLRRQRVVFAPQNLYDKKQITVYTLSPIGEWPTKRKDCLSAEAVPFPIPESKRQTATQHAYLVIDSPQNSNKSGSKSDFVYLKVDPQTQRYVVPVHGAQESVHGSSRGGITSKTFPPVTKTSTEGHPSTTDTMSYFTGRDIYSPITMATLSRTQEREELQRLNDRFAAYVQRVRLLAEQNHQVDSSAILKSAKALEEENNNLKNLYEQELERLRKELENCVHDKTAHDVQLNNQLKYNAEIQDRLSVEVDKNNKLLDQINDYQRRIGSLESEIQDLRIASSRPGQDIEQLKRNIENLTREAETWKHRYNHEQMARQEAENKIQQLMQKMDFDNKVYAEHSAELQSRIESSAATILSLEAKVRDLSKTDVSVSEMLKQVRETAEAELRKFQLESEEQYNRNLSVLKAQIDSDAKALERIETERTQLRGSIGELQAKIRSLEGQVANLEHQKQTLEDAVAVERNRAADSVQSLERKLREVQDLLVVKMREITTAREQNIPLKAEIEALKALLEEEERRLKLSSALRPLAKPQVQQLPSPPTSSPRSPAKTPASGLRVPLGTVTSSAAGTTVAPTSFVSSYNITTTAMPTTAATTAAMSCMPLPSTSAPVTTSTNHVSFVPDMQPYVPSPPLSVNYVPEQLQTPGGTSAAYDSLFVLPKDEDFDPQLYGYTSSVPLAKLQVEPSPPTTPRPVGPIRAKSAPVERQRNVNLVPTSLGHGRDYFDEMFHDLQQDTLYSKGRPKSSPNKRDTGRPLTSLYNDYVVSTSSSVPIMSVSIDMKESFSYSAIGDLKISEVSQDGKFIRLLNDGVQEIEFGGYMLQQNVGGHPVAVYRFPPRTKFAPNSTITVYAGCNDHKLHNPPTDFVWKEQQKWGTGPECTTILCRANGQAVAWTTAAHRFTRDAFQDAASEPDEDITNRADEERQVDDAADDESLTEINVNVNGARPDPVYLRREKQPPPSLHPGKHPHGPTQSKVNHTLVLRRKKWAALHSGNMCLGLVPRSPPCEATVEKPGEAPDVPSPFMKPHLRFQSGLGQVQSQHHADFLPPMPRPPLFSTW
ncbi:hypothetical protein BaRGS_00027256 [Batillaria attramentaria]|uniref:LTD domain-containing protein n=1 Tax=Batillaria attramentaria TaxID=370345 RepID=A0ABD0K2N5_9CAEN